MCLEQAMVVSGWRKLAVECGAAVEYCRVTGQLRSALHLAEAREHLLAAVHDFQPPAVQGELQVRIEPTEGQ